MKNNILLIIAVTVISMGIIAAVIVLSTVGKSGGESSDISSSSSQTTTAPETVIPEPETEPVVTVSEKETVQTVPTEQSDDGPVAPEAEGIIATAESLLGVPFIDGGETPDGFDNSGFIYYVLRQNGYITCPRGVYDQSQMGTTLEYDKLKGGDLVFFRNDGSTSAGFGGIYIGGGKMIACLMPGTVVKEVDITTSYYMDHFFCGVSLS
ncbi:MAG: C40 family peptidase [Oscillospiraceae bacterium]